MALKSRKWLWVVGVMVILFASACQDSAEIGLGAYYGAYEETADYAAIETHEAILPDVLLPDTSPAESYYLRYRRSFESSRHFPFYDGVRFAGSDAFEFLQEVYGNINFFGEFERGNPDIRDYYIRNFARLINNEAPFLRRETGEWLYLSDLLGSDMERLDASLYGLFDFILDGTLQLTIKPGGSPFHVFKYNSEADEFTLILSMEFGSIRGLLASQRTFFSNLRGEHEFTTFDERGEEEYFMRFFTQV